MVASLSKIFHDSSLSGECLTRLPENAWQFSMSEELITYPHLEEKDSFIGRAPEYGLLWKRGSKVWSRFPDGQIKEASYETYFLPIGCIEWATRRIGGPVFTACVCLTALPLGMAIKTIHYLARTGVSS